MNKVVKTNRIKIFILFFLLLLLFSLIFILNFNKEHKKNYINLFFTDYNYEKLYVEKRNINFSVNNKKNILMTLRELSYGPISNNYEPILSHSGQILDVWIMDNFLYINLNEDALKKVQNPALMIEAFNKTIFTNFAFIDRIKFLIDNRHKPTVTGFEDFGVYYVRKNIINK